MNQAALKKVRNGLKRQSGTKSFFSKDQIRAGIRTLQGRTQCIEFEPGVLTEVFDFLQMKLDGFTDLEKEYVLYLDKMAITSKCEIIHAHKPTVQ